MSEYDVGYGKPPKHTQFKKGVCANPRGRGKRAGASLRETVDRVINAEIEYEERGRIKRATRLELYIRRLALSAANGCVDSAANLLKLRAHAARHPDAGVTVIEVIGGPPYWRTTPLPRSDGSNLDSSESFVGVRWVRVKAPALSGVDPSLAGQRARSELTGRLGFWKMKAHGETPIPYG
ncbi:MAG: DUF5681 domain-containing protein, partial [Roseiarcus sp.]